MDKRSIQPHQLIISYIRGDKIALRNFAFYLLLKVQYRNSTFHNYKKRYKELGEICGCGESTIRNVISWMKAEGWVEIKEGHLTLISRKKIYTKITGLRCYDKIKFHYIKDVKNYKDVLTKFDLIIIHENLETQKYEIARKMFVSPGDKKTEIDFKKFYNSKEQQPDRLAKYNELLEEGIKKHAEIDLWTSLTNRYINTEVKLGRIGFARLTGTSTATASRRMNKLVVLGYTAEESEYVRLKMPKSVFLKMDLPSSCFWFKGWCYRRLVNQITIHPGVLDSPINDKDMVWEELISNN